MSLAPERVSIGLRRLFTSPGVDPYDEVVWERRDARITQLERRHGRVRAARRRVPGLVVGRTPPTSSPRSTSAARSGRRNGRRRCARSSTASSTPSPNGASKAGTSSTTTRPRRSRAELKYILVTQTGGVQQPGVVQHRRQGRPAAGECVPAVRLPGAARPPAWSRSASWSNATRSAPRCYDANGVTERRGRRSATAVKRRAARPHEGRLHARGDPRSPRVEGEWRGADRAVRARPAICGPATSLEWHRAESWGEREIDPSRSQRLRSLVGCRATASSASTTRAPSARSRSSSMTMTDDELDWVSSTHVDTVFPRVHRQVRAIASAGSRPSWAGGSVCTAKPLRRLRRAMGSARHAAAAMVGARRSSSTAPLPVVAAYLRSLFQAEGYVSGRGACRCIGLAHGRRGARPGHPDTPAHGSASSRGCAGRTIAGLIGKGLWVLSIQPAGRASRCSRTRCRSSTRDKQRRSWKRRSRSTGIAASRAQATARSSAIEDLGRDGGLRHPDRERRVPSSATSGSTTASSSPSTTRWTRSSTGTARRAMIFKGGSGAGVNLSKHPLERRAAEGRWHGVRARSASCAAPTRRRARSSRAARPAGRRRW